MAKRITVTATQPLLYEGRSHVRGAVFTTTPVDAASLKYRGKVKLGGQLREPSGSTVPDHPSIARRLEPAREFDVETKATTQFEAETPARATPVEPTAAPADASTAAPQESAPTSRRRGRQYQRRDMQAEGSSE